jgi:hypothetical protein
MNSKVALRIINNNLIKDPIELGKLGTLVDDPDVWIRLIEKKVVTDPAELMKIGYRYRLTRVWIAIVKTKAFTKNIDYMHIGYVSNNPLTWIEIINTKIIQENPTLLEIGIYNNNTSVWRCILALKNWKLEELIEIGNIANLPDTWDDIVSDENFHGKRKTHLTFTDKFTIAKIANHKKAWVKLIYEYSHSYSAQGTNVCKEFCEYANLKEIWGMAISYGYLGKDYILDLAYKKNDPYIWTAVFSKRLVDDSLEIIKIATELDDEKLYICLIKLSYLADKDKLILIGESLTV